MCTKALLTAGTRAPAWCMASCACLKLVCITRWGTGSRAFGLGGARATLLLQDSRHASRTSCAPLHVGRRVQSQGVAAELHLGVQQLGRQQLGMLENANTLFCSFQHEVRAWQAP